MNSESIQKGKTRVATVLVNWNQAQRTIDAVNALKLQTIRPDLVVVVDNASGDESLSLLKAALPDALIVVNPQNVGFGSGCNAGIERVLPQGFQYIWLLNNDAIPEEHCLEHLLSRANNDPKVGVVGACIREPNGTVVDHAGTVMNPLTFNCRYIVSEDELAEERYAWITGASMLLNINVLNEIGLFDSGYFMYWEDADLCHRIRSSGFTLAIAQHALVIHEAGTSSHQAKILRYQWHLESQLLWVKKNYLMVKYGLMIVYLRHLVKSVLSLDRDRLIMTLTVIRKNLYV